MPLKRLFRSVFENDPKGPAVPQGMRVYAVGDIHGRLDLLDMLLEQIEADNASRGPASTVLIFLGDLVDRGPQSCQVIQRLLQLREKGRQTRFLLGNHDEVFLKAAGGDLKALKFLIRIGGKETIISYGVTEDEYLNADLDQLGRLFRERVPDEHRIFLTTFENYIEVGDYLFVHAGIRPGIPIERQQPTDLRWIRSPFLNCKAAHGKIVVHGHSISGEADIRKNRIGIDTGAFASGRLTAVGLEAKGRWFITANGSTDLR